MDMFGIGVRNCKLKMSNNDDSSKTGLTCTMGHRTEESEILQAITFYSLLPISPVWWLQIIFVQCKCCQPN